MGELRVWAPLAGKVMADVDGVKLEMNPDELGWWHLESSRIEQVSDYSFSVDGNNFLPDPRSAWQPHGVHGPSRLLDHSLYGWTDYRWQCAPLASAVIYEMHTGTFTDGETFYSAAGHLDYLVDLGITHLEIMPVNNFPGSRGWGYDGVNLYAPHESYGGPQGLKDLVNTCHEKGLAVILDVVYNHLGPEGNYLERFGPYFTDRYSTPWGKAVNLDGPYSDEVRRFFIDNALMWLEDYHIDGLRIDAVHGFADTSATHFLEEMACEVEKLEARTGRSNFLIAESDLNDPRIIRPRQCGGYGMDAQWSDDLHHSLHALMTGEDRGYYGDFGLMANLAKALQNSFVYDGEYSEFRKRRHGRTPTGLPGHSFVVSLQNHDQVGNRALGERIGQLCDPLLQMTAASLIFTSPYIPLIFQGEEWTASSPFLYFTDFEDKKLAQLVREGRKREFSSFHDSKEEIPDPGEESTFQLSKLNWNERNSDIHKKMLDWYKSLIKIRKSYPCLLDGDRGKVEISYSEDERWLLVMRGDILTVCNFSDEKRKLDVTYNHDRMTILLQSDGDISAEKNSVYLPPYGTAIIKLD